ncbi:hypothetical protein T484DRAFT_1934503 [Baffinella frigidus]|nr:hypothetical protein T484DRAFT_1934503 [Cryptophyta sp. CCMP2293]
MAPHSPFEGTFQPYDGYGTYEAEMKALDKLDEHDAAEDLKPPWARQDRRGDVTRGIHVDDPTDWREQAPKVWNKRSAAARKSWAEPGFRERVMQLRASKKNTNSSSPPPPTAAVFTLGENGWMDDKGVAAEGIPLMKRDQNLWMQRRLSKSVPGGIPAPRASRGDGMQKSETAQGRASAWREEKQARAQQRTRDKLSEEAGALALPLLLKSLNLTHHADSLAAHNVTLATLRLITLPVHMARLVDTSGLVMGEVEWIVGRLLGRSDAQVVAECREEMVRLAKKDYQRRYQQSKQDNGEAELARVEAAAAKLAAKLSAAAAKRSARIAAAAAKLSATESEAEARRAAKASAAAAKEAKIASDAAARRIAKASAAAAKETAKVAAEAKRAAAAAAKEAKNVAAAAAKEAKKSLAAAAKRAMKVLAAAAKQAAKADRVKEKGKVPKVTDKVPKVKVTAKVLKVKEMAQVPTVTAKVPKATAKVAKGTAQVAKPRAADET